MTEGAEHEARELLDAGIPKAEIARRLGVSRRAVQRLAAKTAYPAINDAMNALKRVIAGNSLEVEGRVATLVQTEEEAIAAAKIDLEKWDVVAVEFRFYPLQLGEGRVVQGSYVKVRCKRKELWRDPQRIEDAFARGFAGRGLVIAGSGTRRGGKVLRQRIITDLHIGGYVWGKSTGSGNWDIPRATKLALASNAYLDAHVPEDVAETGIAFLGDIFHYDTPSGTTTGGTQLDLDSRVDLMLEATSAYVIGTVEEEAERRPVTVHVLEGNHDRMLSKALRRLLCVAFAKHSNVTVVEQYTPRQYRRWGANLLGFTHGDVNRNRLAEAVPYEAADLWAGTRCREMHTGHLHHEAAKAKLYEGTVTHAGVTVRTHVALPPTDQWHVDNAFGGATRGMSDWYYHEAGAMIGSRVAVPMLLEAA